MKIDNFQKAATYRVYFPILLIASIALIVYFIVDTAHYKIIWLILGLIPTVIYTYMFLTKPYYFNLETKQRSIIIRFFNPHPMMSRKKAFEIPISSFVKYEIKYSMGGKKKSLIFYIKKGKKTGAYPPLSITLLTKTQIEALEKELNTLLKINRLK